MNTTIVFILEDYFAESHQLDRHSVVAKETRISLPCGEQKKSVFPAKNCVDSVPTSFAVSRRAKLFRRLPRELHLTLFPQGNP